MLVPAIGAAALAAGGVCAYGAMAPQSQLFGAALTHGSNPRQIALTYDDGPNDACTPQLLEVLARHGVPATFFMIGRYVKQRPDLARAVASAGHAIGNHTFTHPNLFFCSAGRTARELAQCEQALTDALGTHEKIFRPPFGARRPAVLRAARAAGLATILWSVTCFDWKATNAERVQNHARSQISRRTRYGNIILLHDGGHLAMGADRAHTVAATDFLIRKYKDEGFKFVTIPQMMQAAPVTAAPAP